MWKRARNEARPPVWRRGVAEAIDRAVMLPVAGMAYFFPSWIAAVLAWHLLRDVSPQWRSPGKALCGLRVVDRETGAACAGWRAAMRRLGPAFAQAAWCVPDLMMWALVFDLAAFAWVMLSPTGRRIEDLLVGTEVVTGAIARRREQTGKEGREHVEATNAF